MSAPADNKGRIKIDLSAFYNDYRRQSYILLKSKWSTIKDLKDYVEETFEIKDTIIMTYDEVYIPITEAIDIVSPDDELKIVTSSHIPSPQKPKQKVIITGLEAGDSLLPMKPKRKRTHKRKLVTGEKTSQTIISKVPAKVLKTDMATNVSHVHFDEECNLVNPDVPEVKFVNYIDTLDATKPRIITARGFKPCANEVSELEKPKEVNTLPVSIPAVVEIAAA